MCVCQEDYNIKCRPPPPCWELTLGEGCVWGGGGNSHVHKTVTCFENWRIRYHVDLFLSVLAFLTVHAVIFMAVYSISQLVNYT